VRIVEHPNAVTPHGADRTKEQSVAGFLAGKALLSGQTFTVHEVLVDGEPRRRTGDVDRNRRRPTVGRSRRVRRWSRHIAALRDGAKRAGRRSTRPSTVTSPSPDPPRAAPCAPR
jgi:hypothetical protein